MTASVAEQYSLTAQDRREERDFMNQWRGPSPSAALPNAQPEIRACQSKLCPIAFAAPTVLVPNADPWALAWTC